MTELLFDLTFLTVTRHFISSSDNILLEESYELLWWIIDVFIDHIPTRIIFFLVCNFHLDLHTILHIYNTQMFFKYTHPTQRVTLMLQAIFSRSLDIKSINVMMITSVKMW